MKKKSKFITFILSFLPGLSHLYLGLFERGAIYLFLTGVLVVGTIALGSFYYNQGLMIIALVGLPVVWLIGLLDAFSSLNRRNQEKDEITIEGDENMENTKRENKKIITLALSLIPGAGHMYLGYQKRGLIFMAAFFFTIFFMGWLRISFLVFILPLIWFYSFFDAYHTFQGKETEDIDISGIFPKMSHKYIGIALIVIGVITMFQNMIYPLVIDYLDYRFVNYMQTLIVSILFILGGIKILKGKKDLKDEEIDEQIAIGHIEEDESDEK